MNDTAMNDTVLYRRTMGRFATGVALLATRVDDAVHAITVNSLSSVSLQPAVLSVCLRHESRMRAWLQDGRPFGLSVLAARHEALSRRHAGQAADGEAARWRLHDGAPLMDGALAAFACRLLCTVPVGDHCVLFGEVTHVDGAAEPAEAGEALVFLAGAYRRLPLAAA